MLCVLCQSAVAFTAADKHSPSRVNAEKEKQRGRKKQQAHSVRRCVWSSFFSLLMPVRWWQLVLTKWQRAKYITLSMCTQRQLRSTYCFETWMLYKLVFHLTDYWRQRRLLLPFDYHLSFSRSLSSTSSRTVTIKSEWFNGANACFIGFHFLSRTMATDGRHRERARETAKSCDSCRVIDSKWFSIFGSGTFAATDAIGMAWHKLKTHFFRWLFHHIWCLPKKPLHNRKHFNDIFRRTVAPALPVIRIFRIFLFSCDR